MTSTNDGKDVKSNQTSGQKGKTFYVELYKSLEAGLNSECKLRERTRFLCEAWRRVYALCHHSVPSTQEHLVGWLKRHTYRTLLQTEWQLASSKDERKRLDDAIRAFISECKDCDADRPPWQQQLVQRGNWFQKILHNPWGHPVLKRLLDSQGDSPTDEEVLEWLKEEGGVMFLTRLRQLAASKCDDLALTLASKVMDRVRAETQLVADADQVEDCEDEPKSEGVSTKFKHILSTHAEFTKDAWNLLVDLEFVLLHKRDNELRCIQLAKETPLRDGCKLVERLHGRLEKSPREKKLWKNAKDVATLIAQVVVARCMVVSRCGGVARAALRGAARVLARTLAAPRLRPAAARLAAPAASAAHLHVLADAVHAELKGKTDMIPFMCELYVRAITAGMNELERLKLKTEMETEARSSEKTLASWFTQLGSLLSSSDRIKCECTLTAFSVHPSPAMYETIKAAPTLPPVALDHLDQIEGSTSEFGSWANDSRSMTNLVKTSETLNLKHTLHQANVLSTAILTEGEGLGLGTELCQDIAVLLSGPRLKTLSWDMDRDLLIENCLAYMERTSGGTRAVTTELKYLNLDPKAFQHLPEEEEDENDLFYGIEKGYEHLVELHEPEEIWDGTLIHPEIIDSPYASSVESEICSRRKKKSKQIIESSDDDSGPLSCMAEAKRKEQKKVRPHSKERSKERRKKKYFDEDPLASRDSSQDSKKEFNKKEKKNEKKERKKKDGSQSKPKSLAHLVGMKVTNIDNKYTSSMTDSDYDSQGKSSLSLNSEGTEDVVFDGLYSMDELKSPDNVQSDKVGLTKNKEFSITDGVVAVSKPNVNKYDIDTNAMSYNIEPRPKSSLLDMSSQPYLSTVREEVKKSISRLIEFRRNKRAVESIGAVPTTSAVSSPVYPNASASYRMPSAIVRPEIPAPAQISPKVVAIPEIPKTYISKKQSEQLTKLKNEVNRILTTSNSVPPSYSSIQFGQTEVERNKMQQYPVLRPTNPPIDPVADLIRQHSKHIKKIPSLPRPEPRPSMVSENAKQFNHIQNNSAIHNVPKLTVSTEAQKQRNFQEFLKELQETINAGAGVHSGHKAPPIPYTPPRKEIRPMSRPTPVVPMNMKIENKVTPSAKPQTQPKKLDTSLNTFSRLSYMHRNKQSDTKLQQMVNALIEHQDQNLKKLPPPRILERVASEPKITKPKCQPAKIETATRIVKNPPLVKVHNNLLNKKVERPSTSTGQMATACPMISSMLQNNHTSLPRSADHTIKNDIHIKTTTHMHLVKPETKPTSLSEKDQNDLLNLLRQQNKLNSSYTITKRDTSTNRDAHITHTAPSTIPHAAPSTIPSSATSIKLNTNVEIHQSNKEMQSTKPIVCENLKPKKTSSLTGMKVLNHTVTISKAPVPKTANAPRNHSKSESSEHNNIKKTEVKTENKLNSKNDTSKITKTATDWESVMDAILAQKTPSRGPKALDVALNKSSFAKAFSDSIKIEKVVKSIPAGEVTVTKDAKRVSSSKETPSISSGHKNQQNAQNSGSVKTHSRKSSTESKQSSKSSHSKTSPKSPDTAHASSSKPSPGETPRKPNHQEPHRKLSSEEIKKQFTCPLPKDDDPFISGIANSDYDLLEELMDDDLRQEIGELSTDEDDFDPTAPNVSKRKNIVAEKRVAEAFGKIPNAMPLAATTAMDLCINHSRDANKTTAQMPNLNCDVKMPNVYSPIPDPGHMATKNMTPTKHVQPLLVNENNSNIQMAHNLSMNPTLRDERVVAADNILPPLDPSNLFIAALPKHRYQNIVVINSDVVYEGYPTVQPLHSTVNNAQQNSHVPVTNAANGVYQSAEYSAPVVSPLVLENATAPPPVTTDKVTTSMSTSVAAFNTASQHLKSIDTVDYKQNNGHYTMSHMPRSSANDQLTVAENHFPLSNMKFDFNSNKNRETKLTKMEEDQLLRGKKVVDIVRKPATSHKSCTNVGQQERIAKKRTSIINRKLSHRCDNDPIPLSFTPLDSGGLRDYNEQAINTNIRTIPQEKCIVTIPSQVEKNTNINADEINEYNQSNILGNNQNYEYKIAECDHRRMNDSSKFEQPGLTTQPTELANDSTVDLNLKNDVVSNNVTTVTPNKEKSTPKPRSRKRAPKKASKPTKKDESKEKNKEKTKDKIPKKAKGVAKTRKKTDKKPLKNIVASNNLNFLDVVTKPLTPKIPRLFECDEAVLPDESITDKIVHYQSSTDLHQIGGLDGHILRGPKPVESELFDDLTQFSCDTVSFENIIKEKALLATDFHKENTASPIPILTSTDIETVLEKEKLCIDNKLSYKENVSMNFSITSDREIPAKTIDIQGQVQNAPTLDENAMTQASVSTLGLSQDNAPFFKQVISEIQLRATQQRQIIEEAKRKQAIDEIELKEINEVIKEKLIDDINQKEISNEVLRPEVVKEVNQDAPVDEINRQENAVDGELNQNVGNDDHKEEIEPQESVQEDEQKLTSEEQKQVTDDGDQIQVIDEVTREADKDGEIQVIDDLEQQNVREVEQAVVKDVLPTTAEKTYTKEKHENTPVINNDPIVDLVDDDVKSVISYKSTAFNARVDTEPEIPQSYKDSIKIEQIPSGSKDPLQQCLRIKLPNGRTFKATVYGKVLLDVDALFEEPTLKSLLLSSLTDKKYYTLNIKQVSTASVDNPNRIVETRIQEVNIESKTAPNLVETINLLSDDEDEDVFQYFETEFGKCKVRPMANRVFQCHQNKFNQKCEVNVTRTDLTNFVQPKHANNALVKIKCHKQARSETLSATKRTHTRLPIEMEVPTKIKMSNLMPEPEVIEIDDSSSESFVDVECHEESNKTGEQTISEDPLKILNTNCFVKLVRCDDLVKKQETRKALNQTCYVDLVRIDTRNLYSAKSLDSMDKEVGKTQSQPLPSRSETVTTGRTSPVMEAYEIIARSYYKVHEKLKIRRIKHYENQDDYICKSMWVETKRIVSKLATKNNNEAPRNGFRYSQLPDKNLSETISTVNNQCHTPPSLETLILKYFQNNPTLNYNFTSRSQILPKYLRLRRISRPIKRKLNIDLDVVSNKLSKLSTVTEATVKQNQLIDNESSYLNTNVPMISNFELDQSMIVVEPAVKNSEDVSFQNDSNIETDCVRKEKNIDQNIGSEKLDVDSDQNNIIGNTVALNDLQINSDDTETKSITTHDNSTPQSFSVNAVNNEEFDKATKFITDTKNYLSMAVDVTSLETLESNKIGSGSTETQLPAEKDGNKMEVPMESESIHVDDSISNGVVNNDHKSDSRHDTYEPIFENETELVNKETATENTDSAASNYLENNNTNSTQNHELDRDIEISDDAYINIRPEPEIESIRTQDLETMEQNAIEPNKSDVIVVNIGHNEKLNEEQCETLSENCDVDNDNRNKHIKTMETPFLVETQESEDMVVKSQGMESPETNAMKETKTDLSILPEEGSNYHDNIPEKQKQHNSFFENCNTAVVIPNTLIETSNSEFSEACVNSSNVSEKLQKEFQRTEAIRSGESSMETFLSTDANSDLETENKMAESENTVLNTKGDLHLNAVIEEEDDNHHENCDMESEKTDNDIPGNNLVSSSCDRTEIQPETEKTILLEQDHGTSQEALAQESTNTIDTNEIELTELQSLNSHETRIDVKYDDTTISDTNNDTSELDKSLEIEITVTRKDSENMLAEEESNSHSNIQNVTESISDTPEKETYDRNAFSDNLKHCGTIMESFDDTVFFKGPESKLDADKSISPTQGVFETTCQITEEENKADVIEEESNNHFETSFHVENLETAEITCEETISNEPSKSSVAELTKTTFELGTISEDIETHNKNIDKANNTVATENKDLGDDDSTDIPPRTMDFEASELDLGFGNAIEKPNEDQEKIVPNSSESEKSIDQKIDGLVNTPTDVKDDEIEKRLNEPTTPKNIGEENQDVIENTTNIQRENQGVCETDDEENQLSISHMEHKVIIGDHDYVGNLLMDSNEAVKTLEGHSESLENKEMNDDATEQANVDSDYDIDDTVFNLLKPEKTYMKESIIQDRTISYTRKCKKTVKRKKDMTNFKFNCKRYRKGKNIDISRSTVSSEVNTSYDKEYKALCKYNSSLKFSYSRPFHKDHVEVQELLQNWPISNPTANQNHLENDPEEVLFLDLESIEKSQNKITQSLADELLCKDVEVTNHSDKINETNFNMGFGERSDRVILNLKDGVDVSEVSAATLSDVKQNQPVLQSENNIFFYPQDNTKYKDKAKNDLAEGINLYYTSIKLKNKVKDFFKKSAIELNLMQDYGKSKKTCDEEDTMEFLFGLNFMDSSPRVDIAVHVVQIGQLSVSPAAQNPVTCDPRVTQVSDASPPQCSAENSLHDDHQINIKTEYTELTTADITLPMVHEYEHHEHSIPYEYQESSNIPIINENIPIQTEIKSVVKIELMEEEEKIESHEMPDHNECDTHEEIVNHVHYSFEVDHTNASPEPPHNMHMIYNDSDDQCNGEFSPLPDEDTMEKNNQIEHAMNAAGITTSADTVTNLNATGDHDYNMLSRNAHQDTKLTNGTNTYSKTTVNTMAFQQALAQILPPPLNQVNGSENNQTQNAVTSQVLHIVQGKNASASQIRLVDSAQPSVINGPNATPMLHIVQNKSATSAASSNEASTAQSNNLNGLSLVDAALQKSGNQLLHIVNAASQNNSGAGHLLKRVNLLTNLTNAQRGNEQKMVQFVCKADGKAIQLNAAHQRSMVLRLQPVTETPTIQTNPPKPTENSALNPTDNVNSNGEATPEKSRSAFDENYTKYGQDESTPGSEKATSLPKFNQAFGKQIYQEDKQNEINSNTHISQVTSGGDNPECPAQDNQLNLEDHMGQINNPPLLLRKSQPQTTQSQQNIVQQIKDTIAPMNIQTMHGGVIYTRQIPVNIGGQTINLITVPSTDLVDESGQKQQTEVKFVNQSGIEPSIIKIVPQTQPAATAEPPQESNSQASGSNENTQNPQPQSQPVLTQMRIKLPMLSKAPNVVSGTRVIRPSFLHIQRNTIGGPNQQVYQQYVLTAAPPLGQQTIRLPQSQNTRHQKSPESQSSNESQMSTSTLEQLREFDLVLEQVKERSTVQPNGNASTFSNVNPSTTDTTDGAANPSPTSTTTEPTQQQVLYSIGNTQPLNVAYVNRKTSAPTPTTSSYVRSPDSSGIADSSTSPSSSQASTSHTVTTEGRTNDPPPQPKKSHKPKPRPKAASNPPSTLKFTPPPKHSSQKPLEDEQTTQRILYILAEYKEQVQNSPDKDKPAPRRRNNLPTPPTGSSKRKKGGGHRRLGPRAISPLHGDETCRTMGSEDSSCGTSLGDCNDSCIDNNSPHESPRKVARKLTFDNEPAAAPPPRPQPPRNVIVADGQTITVARGTAGKPTAVFMPANYILPVSMMKGGQQIAIVTNRGPKLLTVSSGGEGGTTNALLLQRLIGPTGLKPMLTRPGFRHVRLPASALQNLQAFNLTTTPATTAQPPDSTASPAPNAAPASAPAPATTPPDLVETRPASTSWPDKESQEVKPERESSPEGSEPWNIHAVDPNDYSYEETVRTENMDRTVLVVHKREGQRQHRLTHVSAAALRHKYAILEHELRLQKSLSEECEDLGVDSPSASELFPEAELLFTASPAHDHAQEHPHSSQPIIHIPKPDLEDQIATDRLISRDMGDQPDDLNIGLEDVGIVTVSEDGLQTTIALNQEEFARAHPNTTFHSEPSEEGEVQPLTITDLKSRNITSTIFHSNRGPGTVLVTAPQTTVISQATAEPAATNIVKYTDIENMIDSIPGPNNNNINIPSVVVKDNALSRFDSLLAESREVHITNTKSAIVRSSGHATQVIRRVCFDDDKREKNGKYLIDEPDAMMAGDDTKMDELSRDAALGSMRDDVDDRSSPDRHGELFWDSNSMTDRLERRRRLDFSSDSDKCCRSPSFDETNSDSGVGVHMRLDSVIKEARMVDRMSMDNCIEETHPPLRTYPPKRLYHNTESDMERSLSGKTRAGASPDLLEARRRVVKRGCHCCSSPAPPRAKKPRPKKPTMDFTVTN